MGYMIDIEKILKKSGLPQKLVQKIEKEVRQEFPKDEMMYELHLMRAIEAERDKSLTAQQRRKR